MTDEFDAFFRARRVAILGASPTPSKLGYRLVENMRATGYTGTVYPVSRSADEILGFRCVPSLRDLPDPPDLVLLSIPAEGVPDAIADAAAIGASAAIVLACGFAEAGSDGAELQRRLLETARLGSLRVIGPNCMGVSDLRANLNATYFQDLPSTPGHVGFISQSGAFGGIAFDRLSRLGVGISKFASIGNMADVTHAELIRYYADDEETRVIAAFIEGIPDGREFLGALREVSPRKPVVVLKAGRTATGSAAAISHTGSLAGDGVVWDALMREAGAVVAEDSEDLFDAAAALAFEAHRLPRGKRLAIVTISGGPSVVAADACEEYGVDLPNLEAGLSRLESLVPSFASLRNPVDLTAQIDPGNYGTAVTTVAEHPGVDGVLAVNVGLDLPEFGEAFAGVHQELDKPVLGYVIAPGLEAIFAEAQIPNLPSVERAVRAFRRLYERSQAGPGIDEKPRFEFEPVRLAEGILAEHQAKEVLADHGFPITREHLVSSVLEARKAAERIGYPLALKVSSPDVTHKSDVGGVLLGIGDDAALVDGYENLSERFPGASVLVQELVSGDLELILGGRRDPLAGPVVMVGLGGVFTEVLRDVSCTGVPTTRSRAVAAIDALRGRQLLDGYRGGRAVDRDSLAGLVERLAALLAANESILEIDLNPVMQSDRGLVVVDALIRAEGSDGSGARAV